MATPQFRTRLRAGAAAVVAVVAPIGCSSDDEPATMSGYCTIVRDNIVNQFRIIKTDTGVIAQFACRI